MADIEIEKYICENCGIEVKCDDWDTVISRNKCCLECCGKKRMGIDTIRRINTRAMLLGMDVDENHNLVNKKKGRKDGSK